MDEQKLIKNIEDQGFEEVQIVEFGDDDKEFGDDHTHDVHTIHHILKGELIILEKGQLSSYRAGEIVEFPAGTTHAAKAGIKGCRMIVGFKKS